MGPGVHYTKTDGASAVLLGLTKPIRATLEPRGGTAAAHAQSTTSFTSYISTLRRHDPGVYFRDPRDVACVRAGLATPQAGTGVIS